MNRWDLDAVPAEDGVAAADLVAPVGFHLPDDWTATVSLGVDALTWRGALIRDARLEGVLSDGVVALNRLSAQMPGAAEISLVGTVRGEAGEPYVDLTGRIEANDLRRLLDWAGRPVDSVPGDRLRRVAGEARLTGTARRFSLTGVDLTIDGTHLTGGLAYVDRGRPGFGLRLELDRINLDAYWPGGRVPPADAPVVKSLTGPEGRVDDNVDRAEERRVGKRGG